MFDDLAEEDVAALPKPNAEALLEQDAAKRVHPTDDEGDDEGAAASLAVSGSFLPQPVNWIVSIMGVVLFAASLGSMFTTKRYEIQAKNNSLILGIKGAKGDKFLHNIYRDAPAYEQNFHYGSSQDEFRGSGREKQMQLAMLLLAVVGSVVVIAAVGPMDVSVQEMIAVYGALTSGDGGSGASDGGGGQAGESTAAVNTSVVACNAGNDLMLTVENGATGNISIRGEVVSTNGGLLSNTTAISLSDGSATARVENLSNPSVSEGGCAVLNATETSIRNNATTDDGFFLVNGSAPGVNLTSD